MTLVGEIASIEDLVHTDEKSVSTPFSSESRLFMSRYLQQGEQVGGRRVIADDNFKAVFSNYIEEAVPASVIHHGRLKHKRTDSIICGIIQNGRPPMRISALFELVRRRESERAMDPNEVYSLTAYILSPNGYRYAVTLTRWRDRDGDTCHLAAAQMGSKTRSTAETVVWLEKA